MGVIRVLAAGNMTAVLAEMQQVGAGAGREEGQLGWGMIGGGWSEGGGWMGQWAWGCESGTTVAQIVFPPSTLR